MYKIKLCGNAITIVLAVTVALLLVPAGNAAESIPAPQGLFASGIPTDPDSIAASFLGIPYRPDGAINAGGEYTLFADQSRRFSTPGLNCSGMVLAMSRFLLGKNPTLDDVIKDRLGDSGPDSPYGEDWDFGWDLIMNISEGFPRRFLLPGEETGDTANGSGFAPRGYDIHVDATWRELPGRFTPGHLYLFSLNVEGRRKGYGLQHYHVGLVHVAASGEAWFYQTTGAGKKGNRRNLKTPQGQASFRKAFANTGKTRKMALVLEVDLPTIAIVP